MSPIYLDFNTTTPLAPSVGEAMEPFWNQHFLLPTQEHPSGYALSELVDHARENVAGLIGCDSSEIVFTSGGTEANNLAIIGLCRAWRDAGKPVGRIIVSRTEHESVLSAANSLGADGWIVERIDVDSIGRVNPNHLESMLRDDTVLVCLQAACGVTGVLQPVRQIADICHSRGALLHCNAAQIAGKNPMDVGALRADSIAISGHKMYGPKGIGALYVRRGLRLAPIMYGEAQEMGLRPGAGNIPGVIGLGMAARMAERGAQGAAEAMSVLRDRLEKHLIEAINPPPIVLGHDSERLSNTTLLRFSQDHSLSLVRSTTDLVVSRPRCAGPQDWMTRSLRAMGLSQREVDRCVRVSVGWTTSHDAIDAAAEQIVRAVHQG